MSLLDFQMILVTLGRSGATVVRRRMEQPFIDILQNQREIARRWARALPEALKKDDLTEDTAQRILNKLGELAKAAEMQTRLMEEQGLGEPFIEAGRALQAMFHDLHAVAGRGLAPLDANQLQVPVRP